MRAIPRATRGSRRQKFDLRLRPNFVAKNTSLDVAEAQPFRTSTNPSTSTLKIVTILTARAVQCRALLLGTRKQPANLGGAPTVRAHDAS